MKDGILYDLQDFSCANAQMNVVTLVFRNKMLEAEDVT